MQNPFDWEQAMETTRRSVAAASSNSENAVAGMVRLLEEIGHHSSDLATLTKAVNLLGEQQSQQIVHSKAALDLAQDHNPGSPRLVSWELLILFAVGVAFGACIVS